MNLFPLSKVHLLHFPHYKVQSAEPLHFQPEINACYVPKSISKQYINRCPLVGHCFVWIFNADVTSRCCVK